MFNSIKDTFVSIGVIGLDKVEKAFQEVKNLARDFAGTKANVNLGTQGSLAGGGGGGLPDVPKPSAPTIAIPDVSEAQKFVEGLVNAEKMRLRQIEELTFLQIEAVQTDKALARAIDDKIGKLKKEQQFYSSFDVELPGLSDAEEFVRKLAAAENKRIAEIRDLITLQNEAVGADKAMAAAIKDRISELKKEQENFRPKGLIEKIRESIDRATIGIQDRHGKDSTIGKMAGKAREVFNGKEGGGGGITGTIATVIGTVSKAFGPIGAAVGTAVTSFTYLAGAATVPAAALVGLAYAASKFTDAINPGVGQRLGLAMRDLQAVIGNALVPVVAGAIPLIKSFSDTMLPVSKQLKGVFAELAQKIQPFGEAYIAASGAVMRTLVPVIKILSNALQAVLPLATGLVAGFGFIIDGIGTLFSGVQRVLAPLLGAVSSIAGAIGSAVKAIMGAAGGLVSGVGAIFQIAGSIINTVFTPVYEVIKGLGNGLSAIFEGISVLAGGFAGLASGFASMFGGMEGIWDGLKETITTVTTYFRKFINVLLLGVASIAKLFGATSFVKGMKDSLAGKKENSTGIAAATNPTFKSIEALGKDMALKAFTARAGEQPMSQDEVNKELVDGLDAIEANGVSLNQLMEKLPEMIGDAIANVLPSPGKVAENAWEGVKGAAATVRGGVSSAWSYVTG